MYVCCIHIQTNCAAIRLYIATSNIAVILQVLAVVSCGFLEGKKCSAVITQDNTLVSVVDVQLLSDAPTENQDNGEEIQDISFVS